jgi:hypothetical protein
MLKESIKSAIGVGLHPPYALRTIEAVTFPSPHLIQAEFTPFRVPLPAAAIDRE